MRVPRALFLGSILLGLGSPMSRDALARETWSEIKHVQILEGPDQIWVFVEVVRITDYSDELFLHLMSKHPDEEIASRSLFTIDRLGKVTEKAVAEGTACRFDPDLNPIFRLSGAFYQYDAGSLERPASFHRWRGDRFGPLDERGSREVKKLLGSESYPRVLDDLKAISERAGWRCVWGDAHLLTESAEPFVSARHQVKISVQMSDKERGWRSLRLSSVVASSVAKDKPWSRKLIEVNTQSQRGRRKSIGTR
jgi:hypothetical protein